MFIGMGGPKGMPGQGPKQSRKRTLPGAQARQQRALKPDEVEPGWTENDIIKGLTHLYGAVNKVQEKAEKDQKLPCEQGCSWCCENVTILLTHAEWLVVLRSLGAGDPKLVRKVLRRCLIAHKKYKTAVEKISSDPENAESHAATMRLPCPFLEDKSCTIYEARPHDCRLYGCSFRDEDLYACHLVEDVLVGRSVTLPKYESSSQLLQLYPRTDVRQTFAYWAKNHLPDNLRELALGPEPA